MWVVLLQQRSFVSQDEWNFVQIGLSKKKLCSKWGFVKVDKSLKWTKRKWVEVERLEDGIAYDLNWRLDFWYRRIEK